MDGNELMCCRQVDILTCNPENLVDLRFVDIAGSLPLPLRMEHYLDQVHNPYLFRVDKLIVKVTFSGKQELSSVITKLISQS